MCFSKSGCWLISKVCCVFEAHSTEPVCAWNLLTIQRPSWGTSGLPPSDTEEVGWWRRTLESRNSRRQWERRGRRRDEDQDKEEEEAEQQIHWTERFQCVPYKDSGVCMESRQLSSQRSESSPGEHPEPQWLNMVQQQHHCSNKQGCFFTCCRLRQTNCLIANRCPTGGKCCQTERTECSS